MRSGLELYYNNDSTAGGFLGILKSFQNIFFKKHLQATASVKGKNLFKINSKKRRIQNPVKHLRWSVLRK